MFFIQSNAATHAKFVTAKGRAALVMEVGTLLKAIVQEASATIDTPTRATITVPNTLALFVALMSFNISAIATPARAAIMYAV